MIIFIFIVVGVDCFGFVVVVVDVVDVYGGNWENSFLVEFVGMFVGVIEVLVLMEWVGEFEIVL